jgi:serine/threonine protein kinase
MQAVSDACKLINTYIPQMVKMESDTYIINYKQSLGHGSFGRVYAGHKVSDPQNQVAIKICSTEGQDVVQKQRLLREVQTLKKLSKESHPNIMHFIDYCPVHDGKLILALQL